MAAIYLFDYTQFSETEYGAYVFRAVVEALMEAPGTSYFNDGDVSRLNAKELAQQAPSHNGDLRAASDVSVTTPLADLDSEFPPGLYAAGLWTNNEPNVATLHTAFETDGVEGYLGRMAFSGWPRSSWNSLMQQLAMCSNIIMCDGQLSAGHNPYGVRLR